MIVSIGPWWHAKTSITASFLDPSDNGFDITDVAAIIALLLAIAGLWAVMSTATRKLDAWRDKRHRIDVEAILAPHLATIRDDLDSATASIIQLVRERTTPIQPGTNGGLSMTDLHLRVGEVAASTARIEERLGAVEKTQDLAQAERATILRVADHNAHAIASAVRQLGGEVADITPLGPDGFPS